MSQSRFRFVRLDPSHARPCFRLRFEVYCRQAALIPEAHCPDGIERDVHDDNAIHLGAYDSLERLVGTVRILRASAGPLPIFSHCKASAIRLPGQFHHSDIAEISRLAVCKALGRRGNRAGAGHSCYDHRDDHSSQRSSYGTSRVANERYQVLAGLVRTGYQVSKREGIRCWITAMEPSLQRRLRRIAFHFEKVGAAFDYYGTVWPYALSVEAFERTAQIEHPEMLSEYARGLPRNLRSSIDPPPLLR
ncbi:MAG: PEP-CTERM/exosortase system-associated acyltransferase [Chromatiales bacterium]|jgi:N-acyl amino acid synthase of PEP-CTERM/exosortase system